MTRTLCLCALGFGLFGLVLATPQPSQAGGHWQCWKFSATAKAGKEARAAARAARKVKRRIKRYGRQKGYALRAGATHTRCYPTGKKLIRYRCTAWARACR